MAISIGVLKLETFSLLLYTILVCTDLVKAI